MSIIHSQMATNSDERQRKCQALIINAKQVEFLHTPTQYINWGQPLPPLENSL